MTDADATGAIDAGPKALAACRHAMAFRFLDTDLELRTDDPAILDLFAAMYEPFRVGEASGIVVHAVTRPDHGPPFVDVDGRVRPLLVSRLTRSHAYMLALNAVLNTVHGFAMVHAGAVEIGGAAAVLLGGTGFGKTSLTLALAASGSGFLSDEFACIERATGAVHPFPRALSIRDGADTLFPFLEGIDLPRVKNIGRGHKRLLAPSRIPGARVARPAPIGHIFLLSDGRDDDGEMVLDVAVVADSADLAEELAALDGVTANGARDEEGYRVYRFEVADVAQDAFAGLCETRRPAVLYYDRVRTRPDFGREPALLPLKKSDAAMHLLTNLRNRPGFFGGRNAFEKGASKGYLEMARLTRNAACHRLVAGDLRRTVDLVTRAMRETA